MDEQRLEELTPEEAQAFLQSFLQITQKRWGEMAPAIQGDGIATEYKVENLEAVFLWVFERLKTISREEDPDVPDWVRNTDSYREGLFDFDEPSENMILGLSYYFGEAFVRPFPKLHWTTGNPEYSHANKPVIAGFMHRLELPTYDIVMNGFRRSVKQGEIQKHTSKMIMKWISFCN